MSGSTFVLRVAQGPAHGTQGIVESGWWVGRDATGLVVGDPYVSRQHAEFRIVGGSVEVRDGGSRRGTFVQGRPLNGWTALQPGESVAFGESQAILLETDRRRMPLPGTYPAAVLVENPGGPPIRHAVGPAGLHVGRDHARAELVINDPTISRRHCVFRVEDSRLTVEDLGSRWGTAVNGAGIAGVQILESGDVVQLGRSQVRLMIAIGEPPIPEGTDVDPLPLAVRLEGESRCWSVEVDADPSTPTRQVVDELAAYLGFSERAGSAGGGADAPSWVAYVPGRGLLLDGENPWWASAVRLGEEVVIAPVRPGLPTAASSAPPAAPVPAPPRRIPVIQLPRTALPVGPERIRLPQVPESTSLKGRGLSWRVLGGMAGVSGGLAVALIAGSDNPTILIAGLVFALVGLLTVVIGILGEQSRRRHAVSQFRAEVGTLDRDLDTRTKARWAILNGQAPPITELVRWIHARDSRIWERRASDPDFLRLRLGTASRAAEFEMDTGTLPHGNPLSAELLAMVARHRVLAGEPVQTPGPAAPTVGLVGTSVDVADLVRSLVLQAAILHSPQDLRIAILATDSSLNWARWLPHVASSGAPTVSWDEASAVALAEVLGLELNSTVSRQGAEQHWLLLVSSAASRLGAVADLLQLATGGRVVIAVTAEDQGQLPPAVETVVHCNGSVGEIRGRGAESVIGPIKLEMLAETTATVTEYLMRSLVDPRAVARRASASQGLLDLLGVAGSTGTDMARHWWDPHRTFLTTPVGRTDTGETVGIGIRRDGPHGLIAGTTGSGKSEFLQTLLAGLACTHGPDELNMFLVDFKGGSTFTDLRSLPHVVGLVTDLEADGSLADRAFTALDAEIVRRKRILDLAGVPDLATYELLSPGVREALPSLLVVIDEFALLVRQQPEVTVKLDNVAAQGRSLGVHLLLATQTPGGVISRAIRANTNTWVCLRVVDPGESTEVIGRPDAASISHETPGRAMLRVGAATRVTTFQTARISRPLDGVQRSTVSLRPWGDARPAVARRIPSASRSGSEAVEPKGVPETELAMVCRELVVAAKAHDVAAQRQLWLPPLPARLVAGDLPEDAPLAKDRLQLRLGLADLPEEQTQRPFVVDLSTSGNAVVIGEFGAGKTTLLTQVALELAEHHPPSELHIYALDAGAGGLNAVERFPHTAAIVGAEDSERLTRLIGLLTRMVEQRRGALAVGGTNWLDWRQSNAAAWVLLLIDDWPVVKEAAAGLSRGALLEQLNALIQAGPAVGIHTLLSTPQRVDLRLQLLNQFGTRILLRQAEAADYDLAGLRSAEGRALNLGPGRAIVAGRPSRHVQVVDPEPARLARVAATDVAGAPAKVHRLPKSVPLAAVLAEAGPLPRTAIAIGVGDDGRTPFVLDQQRMGTNLLIAGDYLSGRSTALRCYLEAVSSADPEARFLVIALRPSPLRSLVDDPRVEAVITESDDAVDALGRIAGDAGRLTHLVIDDADQLPSGVDNFLEPLLRNGRERGLRLCLAARDSDLTRNFTDRWVRYLISLKSGIALMPPPGANALFDTRLPDSAVPMVPGRGYVIDRAGPTLVQLGDPDPDVGQSTA